MTPMFGLLALVEVARQDSAFRTMRITAGPSTSTAPPASSEERADREAHRATGQMDNEQTVDKQRDGEPNGRDYQRRHGRLIRELWPDHQEHCYEERGQQSEGVVRPPPADGCRRSRAADSPRPACRQAKRASRPRSLSCRGRRPRRPRGRRSRLADPRLAGHDARRCLWWDSPRHAATGRDASDSRSPGDRDVSGRESPQWA